MFIKFGDKTKKIIVKKTNFNNENNNKNKDIESIYLDSEEDDRRVSIINKYISDETEEEKEDS